ncbi:MAG: pentapeptide repeat-containing protein, partial [Acidobacteria bacterium]|nr:pentapeptide repeat-containing protein [Acidobacteriota bacterium]
MADDEQVARLLDSANDWNAWRAENPTKVVDISRANLSEAHLSGADLRRADLSGADLIAADLSGADLSRAVLLGA